MLNIVCVNNNNYLGRGDEYVARLQQGIAENCTIPYKFTEFHGTEDGWWAKLQLFKHFPAGERVLYFDLDTVITGNIDDLASYDGDFIALTDFYHSRNIGSGLMAWEAGKEDKIYDRWVELNKPKLIGGDQQWVFMIKPEARRFQDEFKGKVVSYKVHCEHGVPKHASVVCFHGSPRPHEVNFNPDRREK